MSETKSKKTATIEGKVLPDGVKVPQDRKPKDEPKPETLTAYVRGREWSVPADALDDFELLDDLNALEQKGDATRLPAVLRRLLGEQWRDAMDVMRNTETGRVSIEAGSEFVMDVMGALNPNS